MADVGTIVNNSRDIILASGANLNVPKVALATSWAVLTITNASAGASYSITSDGKTIKLTTDSNGTAKMSLYPFISQAIVSSLDNPMPTDGTTATALNKWRGVLALTITTGSNTDSVSVPFIYGGANPDYQVLDRYLDYISNTNLGTWVTLDLADWYNNDGTLNTQYQSAWQNSNFNLKKWLQTLPSGDTTIQVNVAAFNRGRIVFAPLSLHLHYDCRADDVMLVKWLDAEGRINSRQFTFAGENSGGATGSTYNRHHWNKEKITSGDGYWCGLDKWASRTATKQITLGDDGIVQEQFSWIASLVQSPCIEVFAETSKGISVWQRCNIVDAAIERDPRKDKFSATLTFEMPPIYEPQQF